jgi:hypothetical protein
VPLRVGLQVFSSSPSAGFGRFTPSIPGIFTKAKKGEFMV